MDSLNFEVISTTRDWLKQNYRVYFVTVLQTWGASPRPAGSLFAFNVDTKSQIGSLSGGCIEDDLVTCLIKNTSHLKFEPGYELKQYGGNEGDADRYMLPCGGIMEILIEAVSGPKFYDHFSKIERSLHEHLPIARTVNSLNLNGEYTVGLTNEVSTNQSFRFSKPTNSLFHRLNPSYRLLIIGAGDVSKYLADFASSLDFQTIICEPRKKYLERLELFNNNKNIITALPDDLIRESFSDQYSAILCLAHDPKVDDMALLEALTNSNAFYIGAMGSINTSKNRFLRLKSLGLSDSDIKKLHAPIGLDIKSKTPQEIAISILADLIYARSVHKESTSNINPLNQCAS